MPPGPEALVNPRAQGPGSLGGVIPTDPSGPAAVASSPQPKMGALPAAQASTGAGVAPSSENMFLSPKTDAEQNEMKENVGNPFLEGKDHNFPPGYEMITPRVRKNPDGGMEHLSTKTDKWEPMTDAQHETFDNFVKTIQDLRANTKEAFPRFIGALAGQMAGGFFGKPGQIAGGAAGQALGGAYSDYTHGKPITVGGVAKDAALGAAGAAIPMSLEGRAEGAGQAASAAAEQAPFTAKEAAAGQQALGQAQDMGVNLLPEQVFPTSAEAKKVTGSVTRGSGLADVQRMQSTNYQKIQDSFSNLRDKLQYAELEKNGGKAVDIPRLLIDAHSNEGAYVRSAKQQAYTLSGEAPQEMDGFLSSTRNSVTEAMKGANIFFDDGRINPTALNSFTKNGRIPIPEKARVLLSEYKDVFNLSKTPEVPEGGGEFKDVSKGPSPESSQQPPSDPGLSLRQMQFKMDGYAAKSKIGPLEVRSPSQEAYGRLYRNMRMHSDQKFSDVLKADDPESSAMFLDRKANFSRDHDLIEDFQAKVEKDPTNAARILIDKNDPGTTKAMMSMLEPDQRKYIAGSYIDILASEPIYDPRTNKFTIAPFDKRWRGLDPGVKDAIFDKDAQKTIDSSLNVAIRVNNLNLKDYNPASDKVTQRLLGLFMRFGETAAEGASGLIDSVLNRNYKAADFMKSQLALKFAPKSSDPAALAKRQMFYNSAAKASFIPAPYAGASAGAALTPAPQQQGPIPPRQ